MKTGVISIRAFIGSSNFELSRRFYSDLGFEEVVTSSTMSYFRMGAFGFYLQDYYVKDWVENSMVFLEVEKPEDYLRHLHSLNITHKYPGARVSEMEYNEWGNEFFIHDPSGVLWHVGEFK